MELKTSKELESSAYRCLFEYVKKEGIEPALDFFKDIADFYSDKNTLLKNSILLGRNDLIKISRRNKDIVKYIREHKKDMKRLCFTDKKVLTELNSLQEDNTLIDLYLENARKLEDLKVSDIAFVDFFDYESYCRIYRNKDGEIIRIQKQYTDDKIKIVEVFEEELIDKLFNYSGILYRQNREETTFSLSVENTETEYSIRKIEIKDFGFDGSKLPTEEEISSYDIPIQLIKK